MSRVQHCAAPCNLARAIAVEDREAIRSIHMAGELIPASSLLKKCPCGLTSRQAVLLTTLFQRQGVIISYAELSELFTFFWGITTTRVAVRELVEKLNARGFFEGCCAAQEGILQGKCYQLSRKCCPLLEPPHPPAHAPAFPPDDGTAPTLAHAPDFPLPDSVTSAVPLLPASPPLHLKEEEDEEKAILPLPKKKHAQPTLADDFFAVVEQELSEKWPFLRRVGFDFATFKRAAVATTDTALLLKTWRSSLDYAEFDLQHHDGMREPNGTPIKDPRTWVYGCLRKSGSYPRPRNYKTEDELRREAKRKSEEERRKQQEEEAFLLAFEKWRVSLSEEDIREIAGPYCRNAVPLPLLRNRFRQIQKQHPSVEHSPQSGGQQAMSPLNTATLALRG